MAGQRTRIKFCGLTREADVAAAVEAGTDSVGFICFPKSPRYVPPLRIALLAREAPIFVTPVLVFVNPSTDLVESALEAVPHALLQFHGTEVEAACHRFQHPYMRSVPMGEGVDLLDYELRYPSAAAFLLDTPAESYGGTGKPFDWSRIQSAGSKPLVLAGGLNPDNVRAAITAVRPYAVDVSSGVETEPGVKSADLIHRFAAAVRAADSDNNRP